MPVEAVAVLAVPAVLVADTLAEAVPVAGRNSVAVDPEGGHIPAVPAGAPDYTRQPADLL